MNNKDDSFVKEIHGEAKYAILEDGTMPAKKELHKLKSGKTTKEKYFFLRCVIMQWCKTGDLPKDHLDAYRSKPGLFKFKGRKGYPYRIVCFIKGRTCYLVSVIKKPKGVKAYQKKIDNAYDLAKKSKQWKE